MTRSGAAAHDSADQGPDAAGWSPPHGPRPAATSPWAAGAEGAPARPWDGGDAGVAAPRAGRAAVPVPFVRARDGFLAVAVFSALMLIGFGLTAVGAKALGIGGGSGLVAVLIGGGTAGAVGTTVLARARAGLSAAGLGLVRPRRSLWHLMWQVPSAIVGSAILAALGGRLLGLAPSGGGAADDLAGPGVPLVLGLAGTAVASLLVPVVEEVVFRRYLLDGLRGRFASLSGWGTVLAVAVTTGVFAAAHVAPAAMLYVAPLGACMACMRIWYASVWPGVVLHVVNNSLITAAVFAAAD